MQVASWFLPFNRALSVLMIVLSCLMVVASAFYVVVACYAQWVEGISVPRLTAVSFFGSCFTVGVLGAHANLLALRSGQFVFGRIELPLPTLWLGFNLFLLFATASAFAYAETKDFGAVLVAAIPVAAATGLLFGPIRRRRTRAL